MLLTHTELDILLGNREFIRSKKETNRERMIRTKYFYNWCCYIYFGLIMICDCIFSSVMNGKISDPPVLVLISSSSLLTITSYPEVSSKKKMCKKWTEWWDLNPRPQQISSSFLRRISISYYYQKAAIE
ncbi:MAG: hypothetical protein M3146_00280 [Thermoproteota archaeon]|nr:hypothetical protein [Thermoproteota archaeon]